MTDQQFEKLFQQAKELMLKTKDEVHDWTHIERVLASAQMILAKLPVAEQEKIDEKILNLAIAWHDTDFVFRKPSVVNYFLEGRRVAKLVEKYFQAAGVKDKEIDLVKDIVKHHTNSSLGILNKKRSLSYQIVQDADTMDSFVYPHRLEKAKKQAHNFWYYRVLIKILKPIFFNFLRRHPKIIYNQPEIIKQLTSNN